MILLRWIFVAVLLFCSILLSASGLLLPWSAEAAASSCSSLLFHSPASCLQNPAVSASGFEFSCSRLYGLPEIPIYFAAAGFNRQILHLAFALSELDHVNYRELTGIANTAGRLHNFNAGFNCRYHRIDISGKGSRQAVSFDLGCLWNSGRFQTAACWLNCSETKLAGQFLPAYFVWESSCAVDENLTFSIRLEKETGFEFQPALATRYDAFPQLALLASGTRNPDQIGSGFCVSLRNWHLAYAAVYHAELDFTHYISLRYEKNPLPEPPALP